MAARQGPWDGVPGIDPAARHAHRRASASCNSTSSDGLHPRPNATDQKHDTPPVRGCAPAGQPFASMTWWPWRGRNTRSHPELGRETPQRRWYCVLRRGRVGHRQVFQANVVGLPLCSVKQPVRPGTVAPSCRPPASRPHNARIPAGPRGRRRVYRRPISNGGGPPDRGDPRNSP